VPPEGICTQVHVVAARLGHADPSITLRVYAHVISLTLSLMLWELSVAEQRYRAVLKAGADGYAARHGPLIIPSY
jgi:integrase